MTNVQSLVIKEIQLNEANKQYILRIPDVVLKKSLVQAKTFVKDYTKLEPYFMKICRMEYGRYLTNIDGYLKAEVSDSNVINKKTIKQPNIQEEKPYNYKMIEFTKRRIKETEHYIECDPNNEMSKNRLIHLKENLEKFEQRVKDDPEQDETDTPNRIAKGINQFMDTQALSNMASLIGETEAIRLRDNTLGRWLMRDLVFKDEPGEIIAIATINKYRAKYKLPLISRETPKISNQSDDFLF